jgi:predicted helicase
VYRNDYAVDLLREFPRLPLYHDFAGWRDMGNALLDLHIGFEDAQPYPLERVDKVPSPTGRRSGRGRHNPSEGTTSPRVMLRANVRDKERGEIQIDSETTLRGVPADAWRYRLGSRSALEWVLDQYKEKKPRDPTIRERFNTYRFADYKEDVIELLTRVCAVSVRTMEVVDGMAYWDDRIGKM